LPLTCSRNEARALAGLGRCTLATARPPRPGSCYGRRWRYCSGSARPRPTTSSANWPPSPRPGHPR